MADNGRSPMDTSNAEESNVGLAGKQQSRVPLPPVSTIPAIVDDKTELDEEDEDGLEVAELNTSQHSARRVSKPFVYGSISRALPRAQPNGATHAWTVYLRPRHNEDMSLYVGRVEFCVDSIPLIRVCTEPPYELSQVSTGCAQFDVQIKLFFVDTSLPPVTLTHTLKLDKFELPPIVAARNPLSAISGNPHQQAKFGDRTKVLPPGKPIVAERYDELIFANSSDTLHSNLVRAWEHTRPDWKPPKLDWDEQQFHQLDAIQSSRKLAQEKIHKLKDKLANMKEKLIVLQQEGKRVNSELKVDEHDLVEVDMQVADVADDGLGACAISLAGTKSNITMKMVKISEDCQ